MNRIRGKLSRAIKIIMVLAFLVGSYFGIRGFLGINGDANIVGARTKTYDVYENEDLVITGTEVDVLGKTFEQIKEEMRKEAEKNGGVIGEQYCESEEKLDYEDDEYVVTSREQTYKSGDEHKKFRKKLQENKESSPKTDDNVLIYENIEDAMMQMEYPSEIPYPRVNQFDVFVSSYPNDSIYCEVSADIGKVSKSKIDLGKENRMTYYLPDHFDDYMVDVISFKFYGEYSKLVKEHKIYILYDEKSKKVKMAGQKVQ